MSIKIAIDQRQAAFLFAACNAELAVCNADPDPSHGGAERARYILALRNEIARGIRESAARS